RCANISKTMLESAFLSLLDTLKPRPEYWRAIEVAVFDVWKAEHRDAAASQGTIRQHITALETKCTRLDETYLYDRTIDAATYQAQRDKLREEIAMARIELTEATATEMDLEGMMTFARHALSHASAIWTAAATPEERLKVQWTFL